MFLRLAAATCLVFASSVPALSDDASDCKALVAEAQARLDSKQIDNTMKGELQGRLGQAAALCSGGNPGDGMAYASEVAGQLDTL